MIKFEKEENEVSYVAPLLLLIIFCQSFKSQKKIRNTKLFYN